MSIIVYYNNIMDSQDWKPIVFKKKPVSLKSTTKVPAVNINSNNTFEGSGKKINDDDCEISKPLTVGIEIGKQIALARTTKKITQKQLSTQMNLLPKVIQQNENGTAIRNNALLAQFEKALGIRLKR